VSTDLGARNGAPQETIMMETTLEFDDEDAMTFLMAKRCMEDELDDTMDYDDEFVTRLCERYLDQRKGEGQVYETDDEIE
jgi:hypothetical protein